MKALIRKILVGDVPIREYATIALPDEIQEQVYLEINGHSLEVTKNQWVFCLEPLVFGLWIEDETIKNSLLNKKKCRLVFYDSSIFKSKTAIADLELKESIVEQNGVLFLFALKTSRVCSLNFIKTQLLFKRYYKKPGLSFEKFKSFVTAYSYPRKVRIISFRSDDHYNIFPMDLVGELRNVNRMAFGLRHTNRTLSKIIESKKIVACEIPFTQKETIYKLGSHHSTAPPSPNELPFKVSGSKNFGFYIPEWAWSYKEIEILQTINLGSHMLMWGKIINETTLAAPVSSLYHIHFLHYLHQKKKGIQYPLV